jgi:hypothetical protein
MRFLVEYQEEVSPPSIEDLHSRIKSKIISLLPSEEFCMDDNYRTGICNCLAALEEFGNEHNSTEDESNGVLICLYTLSKLVVPKKRGRSKNVSGMIPPEKFVLLYDFT